MDYKKFEKTVKEIMRTQKFLDDMHENGHIDTGFVVFALCSNGDVVYGHGNMFCIMDEKAPDYYKIDEDAIRASYAHLYYICQRNGSLKFKYVIDSDDIIDKQKACDAFDFIMMERNLEPAFGIDNVSLADVRLKGMSGENHVVWFETFKDAKGRYHRSFISPDSLWSAVVHEHDDAIDSQGTYLGGRKGAFRSTYSVYEISKHQDRLFRPNELFNPEMFAVAFDEWVDKDANKFDELLAEFERELWVLCHGKKLDYEMMIRVSKFLVDRPEVLIKCIPQVMDIIFAVVNRTDDVGKKAQYWCCAQHLVNRMEREFGSEGIYLAIIISFRNRVAELGRDDVLIEALGDFCNAYDMIANTDTSDMNHSEKSEIKISKKYHEARLFNIMGVVSDTPILDKKVLGPLLSVLYEYPQLLAKNGKSVLILGREVAKKYPEFEPFINAVICNRKYFLKWLTENNEDENIRELFTKMLDAKAALRDEYKSTEDLFRYWLPNIWDGYPEIRNKYQIKLN
ncbi:MAG: hypothetical protein LBL47_01275 [Lactobacillus sp.]|jgi:hypothetical protein|nr:hypothetical protein [Lactobacillus sp.]